MPKDDILTLKVPGANLVFTRYLYIKDEVKTALLIAILNKSDDSIFWAYELYYSGFKNELFAFIWQIYYDFFATLNPTFAVYLSTKLSNKENLFEDRLISSIIQNLLIRSFNADMFLLRTIAELFVSEEEPETSVSDAIETFLLNEDYRQLSSYILSNKERKLGEEIEIYKIALNYFKLTNQQKLAKDFKHAVTNATYSSIVLLANIMSLITQNKSLIKKKNFYVRVDPEEVVQYETIEANNNLKPYRILPLACTQKIQNNWFNLFECFRNQTHNLKDKAKYNEWTNRSALEKHSDNWLYHASFSPTWFARIKTCKGYVDYINQEVRFISEDCEEDFYSKYGYDPDEQSIIVKENTLKQTKSESTWQQFFATYQKTGLVDALNEELDALNEEPLKYV